MPLTNLIAAMLRLFSLWWLARDIISVISNTGIFSNWCRQGILSDLSLLMQLGYLTGLFFFITTLAIFWFYALPIAKFLTRGVEVDIPFGAVSRKDWYCVAFVAVGAWLVLNNLAGLMWWCHMLLKLAAENGAFYQEGEAGVREFAQHLIKVVMGGGCIMGAHKWAALLVTREEQREKARS